TDDENNVYPSQIIEASGKIGGDRVRFVVQATIQGYSWKKLKIERNTSQPKVKSSIKASAKKLSNEFCEIVFDGIPDKNEIAYSPAQVFADSSDTWGHEITGFTEKKGLFKIEKITVIEKGQVRARVRVESRYGSSRMEEDFILYEGSDFIEQRVFLDWRKTNAVLKLRYQHDKDNAKIFYEIPYSVLERPMSPLEVPGQTWAFIHGRDSGIGIMNDAKSSYSSDEKYFYITCARSPLYAHHAPPHILSNNEQLRYLDQGEQEFTVRVILGKKNWQEAEMPRRALEFLEPPVVHLESAHEGKLSEFENGFEI